MSRARSLWYTSSIRSTCLKFVQLIALLLVTLSLSSDGYTQRAYASGESQNAAPQSDTVMPDMASTRGIVAITPLVGDVAEGDGRYSLQLVLTKPTADYVQVNVVTVSGTATGGVDYNDLNLIVIFDPYETVTNFSVAIRQDTLEEPAETFQVKIDSVLDDNAIIISSSSVTVTIIDDDGPPTPTHTATPNPTYTPTNTPTSAPTWTPSPTPTAPPTWTPIYTPTQVDTPTYTPDPPTLTPTQTPTSTPTDTPTHPPTWTPTPTPTPPSTWTPTPTPIIVITATPAWTFTSTPTAISTVTYTVTYTVTATATYTVMYTATYSPTATNTALPTATNTALPTETYTPTTIPTSTIPTSTIPTSTPNPTLTPEGRDEIDPCDQIVSISPNGLFSSGEFEIENDVDWFTFDGVQGTRYEVSITIPDGSPADANVDIYPDCIADSTGVESIGTRSGFTAQSTGQIYLRLNNNDGSVAGSHVQYRIAVDALPEKRIAIIVAGRRGADDGLQNNIYQAANSVFSMFQIKGYTSHDINYLASVDYSGSGATEPLFRDDDATLDKLKSAIITWTVGKAPNVLNLYIVMDGEVDKLYLNGNEEALNPGLLDDWLSQLESAVPGIEINIFIDANHAGSFIQEPQGISKAGRVIVTSSNQDRDTYVSRDSTYFSEHFVTALRGGANVHKSWEKASSNIRRIFPTEFQEPWIDGDGNGVHNEPNDFTIAAQRHLDQMGTLGDAAPPEIIHVGMIENSAVITAEVSDGQSIERVWAVIYPPSYVPRTNRDVSLVEDGLHTIDLKGSDTEVNTYRGDAYDFAEPGTYLIVVQAKDQDGLVAEPNVMELEIMEPETLEPEVMETDNQEIEGTNTSQRLYLPFVSQ